MGSSATRTAFVTALRAVDDTIAVADDPRDVNPPCVLVGAPTLQAPTVGCPPALLAVPVTIIAPGPADTAALIWLLDTCDAFFPATGALEATPGEYDVEKPYPCYRMTALVPVQEA